ncbi:hypothetical protein TGVAND_269175 [Toxoplasma gondii VAND]|uniref:U6 snRNA phosphodiesterase 1 n=1 Tax=Toxoplasma gondii VAND TaxID=933077 RepID=A0A086Q0J9_TOXGO|nr:hypothetical protein TGVAND_269175 [Toxoplasma gondii VAND]
MSAIAQDMFYEFARMQDARRDTADVCARLLDWWDDPAPTAPAEQHRGRKRQIPHADGNFATFVYIPVPRRKVTHRLDAARASLRQLCRLKWNLRRPEEVGDQGHLACVGIHERSNTQPPLSATQNVAETSTEENSKTGVLHKSGGRSVQESVNVQEPSPNHLVTDSSPAFRRDIHGKKPKIHRQLQLHTTKEVVDIADLHLSLSRTFMLQYHLIEPFLAQITTHLRQFKCFTVELQTELDIFSNADHSCFFAALTASPTSANHLVSPVVKCVDEIVTRFGGEPFSFRPFRPHVSLAWTAEDIRPALRITSRASAHEARRTTQRLSSSGDDDDTAEDGDEGQLCWPQIEDALQQFRDTQTGSQVAQNCPETEAEEEPQVEAGATVEAPSPARIWIEVQKVCVSVGNRISSITLQGGVSDSDSSSGTSDTEGM